MLHRFLIFGLVITSLMLLNASVSARENAVERPMILNETGAETAYLDPANWVNYGDGTFGIPWTTVDSGTATHLGEFHATSHGYVRARYLENGQLELLGMWGEWELTADDGSELSTSIVWPDPNALVAIVTIHGGTGRFENASGSLNYVYEVTGESWSEGVHIQYFSARAEGTITY